MKCLPMLFRVSALCAALVFCVQAHNPFMFRERQAVPEVRTPRKIRLVSLTSVCVVLGYGNDDAVVGVGEWFHGWRVVAIQEHGVVLEKKDGERKELVWRE